MKTEENGDVNLIIKAGIMAYNINILKNEYTEEIDKQIVNVLNIIEDFDKDYFDYMGEI
jgi:hypothetical protein